MPIYEYECKKCKLIFENYVLTIEEVIRCPKCGNSDLAKLISAPNFSGSSGSSGACGNNSGGFS